MKNLEISEIFRDIAKILEIKGDNPFRIRAYERAATHIEGLTEDIENVIKEERLLEIPGIGKDLAEKIKEIVRTGRLKAYEELKKTIPEGLLELLNIPSVGPKTAKLLYEKLKIKNIIDLKNAIKQNRLEGVFGIKEKTVENILRGMELVSRGKERLPLATASQLADEFLQALKKLKDVKRIAVAGSLRRQKETVRDIDILVISDAAEKVMHRFTHLPLVKDILAEGETKSSVRIPDDIQVDCRVVEEKSFGAALLYFTGSKNFNIKVRKLAIQKGLKINEYGVFKDDLFLGGKTETEIFKILGMSYIEPELREETGEIELALKHKLPKLIELGDIKGDFHVHSQWSDGNNTIEEMADEGINLGYSYMAITDHSLSLKVARGLGIGDLEKKRHEIQKINKNLKGLRILYATEVDIDSKGKLDYSDKVLKEFDLVVAAIHSGFKQSQEQLTKRMINACKNKYVHIIAHPTGRLWGTRDPYEVDFERILKVAKETNTSLEINTFPQRFDLDGQHCRWAKEMGVKLAIGTDAHTRDYLSMMKFGVSVARRGWLSKEDVLNTLSVEHLLRIIKK
jgi:DNA polymerase (family 10)